MTFRSRLVLASTVAVVIAVLLAATAAFLVARKSLYSSLDSTLSLRAQTMLGHPGILDPEVLLITGDRGVIVPAGAQGPAVRNGLPLTPAVQAVANREAPPFYTTVHIDGVPYREYVTYLNPGTSANGLFLPSGGALQLATNMSATTNQLTDLGVALVLVAICGVVLSVLLGWLVARATLGPLNDLTDSVEDMAETTDVSRRLDPGGIDELGRLRRAFNRLLAALEASRESQRQLVLDTTHEIRTPLTSLRTNLEVVRRLDELPPEERDVLVDDVLTQMGELTQLVGDLAQLARGEVRHQDPVPLRLDLLVDDAVTVAATHGRHRGIHLEATLEPCWVEGQPEGIARAVGNLLDNALKWSPDGAAVEVTCAAGEVTVRDHGPGISPEDLPHVFDRFYRAKNARALPGSGLGLAIVAQVAQLENGTVTAGEALGGGAIFRFRLPVVAPPSSVDPASVTEGPGTAPVETALATPPDPAPGDPGPASPRSSGEVPSTDPAPRAPAEPRIS
jgi:two-component system sensor histidine kinase MprB